MCCATGRPEAKLGRAGPMAASKSLLELLDFEPPKNYSAGKLKMPEVKLGDLFM